MMKIVILGAGQVGRTLAEQLLLERNDVTLVDISASKLMHVTNKFDLRTLTGNAAYPEILESAGTKDADMLIAVTGSDEVNMLACEIAHHLFKVPYKVARVRANEYTRYPQLFSNKAIPLDVLINPERLITNYVMRLIEYPGALQVLDLAEGRIEFVIVKALKGAPLIGLTLNQLHKHLPSVEAKILTIARASTTFAPNPDTIIEIDDEVFFIASKDNVREVISELRAITTPYQSIMIAGGGNIGFSLAQKLEQHYQVKIVEFSKQRCRKLSENLEKTVVLHGNAVDENLLFNENINNTDVFCALTDDDEINIMSSTMAKRMGARKVMTLINRQAYVDLLSTASAIDIVISPQMATMSNVLSHIRRGDIVQAHSLRYGQAEVLEIIAHGTAENSKVVGQAIEHIPFPRGVLVGALVRGGSIIIAEPHTVIMPEDHAILFVPDKRDIPKVEHLFQVGLTFF